MYNCPVCKDNGWLLDGRNAIRCQCQAEADAERIKAVNWNISGLPEPLRQNSLKAYDVRLAGDRKARDAAAAFIAGTLPTPWLYLEGGFETGKTYLASCIVRGCIERGQYALYCYVPKMLQRLRDALNGGNYGEQYSLLEKPDVLILDDLGTEKWTDWAVEVLTVLFEDYYENRKRLVITSNVDIGLWPKEVGRIRRRIEDSDRCTALVNNSPRYGARKHK